MFLLLLFSGIALIATRKFLTKILGICLALEMAIMLPVQPKDYFEPDLDNSFEDIDEAEIDRLFKSHPDFRVLDLYEDDYFEDID